MDMRGHGKSLKVTEEGNEIDMSLAALIDDVDVVLTTLCKNAANVVDVHLIGHSLGAAVLAAFSRPEKY